MEKGNASDLDDVGAIALIRSLPCRPKDAWAALTDPENIAVWWGDYVTLDAAPGGTFCEVWRDGDGREVVTSGRVAGFSPPRLLSLTWKDDDWPVETMVTFALDADGDGTALTLTHDGWAQFPPADAPRLRLAHATGWSHHLDNLAAFLGAGR